MSYKVEVHESRSTEWNSNSIRFATSEEADLYGSNLLSRWFAIDSYRIAVSNDPVNYKWDGKLVRIQSGEIK